MAMIHAGFPQVVTVETKSTIVAGPRPFGEATRDNAKVKTLP